MRINSAQLKQSFDAIDKRFDRLENLTKGFAVSVAHGFERVETRLDKVEDRLEKVENELVSMNNRFVSWYAFDTLVRRVDIIEGRN